MRLTSAIGGCPPFSAASAPHLSQVGSLTTCAPLMLALDSAVEGWLLAVVLLAVPLVFVLPDRIAPDRPLPSAGRLWRLALIALAAPLFCPTRGVPSTVVTGLAVVLATRLPDLSRRPSTESTLSRVLWLLTPIVRSLPDDASRRQANRNGALRFVGRALAKRLCWEPFGYVMTLQDPQQTPAVARTALLILYFVLNLTALADLALALARLIGADTEEVFDWPLLATSPREFWSRRWNRYVSRFALRHVARPLQSRLPRPLVTISVFFVSALFHEYFAWGAAGAATQPGTMTAFFLAQGLAVVLGERLPLPRGTPRIVGHLGTVAWMVLTAPWFFASLRPALLDFGVPTAWLVTTN